MRRAPLVLTAPEPPPPPPWAKVWTKGPAIQGKLEHRRASAWVMGQRR